MEGGDFGDAFACEIEHGGHLFVGEDAFLAAALKFDKFEVFGHDDIKIDAGVFVLGVVEVEDGGILINTRGDACDEFFHREGFDFSRCEEFVESDGDGDATTGDGCGAGPAVGLQDIAIEPDGPWSEGLEVDHGPERASDEPLDFGRAAIESARRDIALFTVERRIREHIVFGGEPATADFLVFHPSWHVFLHGGSADDACVAKGDEGGSCGMGGDSGLERDGAELIVVAAVGSSHVGSSKFEV